jgi:hypothetical protein
LTASPDPGAGPWQTSGPNKVIAVPAPGDSRRAAIREFEQAMADYETEQREIFLRWQAIMCTCLTVRRRATVTTAPGNADCLIHGHYMVTHDGRVL